MTTTVGQNIRGALQARTITATGFPAAQYRAYEGRKFTPPPGQAWARMTLKPVQQRAAVVGAAMLKHEGLFQVDVFYPDRGQDGPGTADVEILADAVRDVFRPGVSLTQGTDAVTVQYAERGEVSEPDDGFLRCSVTVGWICYSPN